jgi:hypothetical protein
MRSRLLLLLRPLLAVGAWGFVALVVIIERLRLGLPIRLVLPLLLLRRRTIGLLLLGTMADLGRVWNVGDGPRGTALAAALGLTLLAAHFG